MAMSETAHKSVKVGNILHSIDLLLTLNTKLIRDRCHALLTQARNRLGVIAKIKLGTDEDDRDVGSVMRDFRIPLADRQLQNPFPLLVNLRRVGYILY